MLGGILALIAAFTFASNNAAMRRGALTGSAAPAMAISLALGLVMFVAVVTIAGAWNDLAAFPTRSVLLLCTAGILHFGWGRYCNFRATKAMGANLVGPPQQSGIVLTLLLAILLLGETLTPLKIAGILLILLSPAISLRTRKATAGPDAPVTGFRPNLAEGYTFAFLSAIGFGASPILVSAAIGDGGVTTSLAGGLIAYAAATVVLAFMLLAPGRIAEVRAVDRTSTIWFSISAALVCISQMTTYMALSVAPVSVVMPIQRLSLVFRIFTNAWLNPKHEVLGGRIWAATLVGLLGAGVLSISTDYVLDLVTLPDSVETFLRWRWPN